jgi:hypothetical protein
MDRLKVTFIIGIATLAACAIFVAPAVLVQGSETAPRNEAAKAVVLDDRWLHLQPTTIILTPRDRVFDVNAFGPYKAQDSAIRPLSSVKLFDSGGISAEWRIGGPIQYKLSNVNPLGASFGGKVSTNSVKFTLTWSGQK